MRSNLDRIAHLTEAFRQVAINERPLPTTTFSVYDSLATVRQSFAERLAATHVQVDIECDPALLIDGVANDWSSIVANLIGNSLQHGFKGRSHGRIRIQVSSDAKRWQLRYRDDGVGMSADTLARIFDPFFTTDLQNGLGLGMYLVYNLVTHRMHGTIHCDSAPDTGVNFQIDIPR
jgi:signal transduction histidine kinase